MFFLGLNFICIDTVILLEFELVSFNSLGFFITILLDWISLLFISFVLYISSIVIFYREGYIRGDLNINRFIILITLFVLSIIFLIISPNLVRILLGWDGLGLVSYCLVIYYQNSKSYNAGMITALRNRVGDVALLISIAWIVNYGSWNYLFYLNIKDHYILWISSIVILAAITKRAQIPFSSWLPAAMAAPTPVSSLVHSSTLVTAGVYLLIRFRPSFNRSAIIWLLLIASLTIFIRGLGANFEFDLKKIIALSTLRQLGLIISILAIGERELAFFHLLTHALFKALLFICAGVVIHNLGNCQDIRRIGGISVSMPLTCTLINIRNMALCGLPFLAGFYSKDLILEVISINSINIFIYLIFYLSTGLTVRYRIRLTYYSLIGDSNLFSFHRISEEDYIIIKGMFGLIFIVVVGGRSLRWIIFPTPSFICLPFSLKIITLLVITSGGWLGLEVSKFKLRYSSKSLSTKTLSTFFASIWNIPFIRTYGINYYPVFTGGLIYNNIDRGWSEYTGPQGIYLGIKILSQSLQGVFNNNIKIYLLLIVIWVIMVLLIIYSCSLY